MIKLIKGFNYEEQVTVGGIVCKVIMKNGTDEKKEYSWLKRNGEKNQKLDIAFATSNLQEK